MESLLTFDVQLSVNDVAHDRRVVQVLHRVLGSSGAGEQDPGQAQVFPGLWVEQDLHLLHLAKLGTHLRQEGLLDVVIEAGKRHLLEGNWTHIELVQLSRREGREMRATDSVHLTQRSSLAFDSDLELWHWQGELSVAGPQPPRSRVPQFTHRRKPRILQDVNTTLTHNCMAKPVDVRQDEACEPTGTLK